ncbi:hypothetical protein [Planobispora rosea]|nr:hypothetical protein [Planobispora rosea]
MNKVLPETPRDVALQVDSYKWLKIHYYDLYAQLVLMVKTRGGAR